MSDHDGHTINVGPVTVGETLPKADPIDTDDARREVCLTGTFSRPIALCDEVDRLRAVVRAADEVWRCHRCGGGGLIAPGDWCQTCAGDGLRVEWADDGSDLRPLVEALAALAGVQP